MLHGWDVARAGGQSLSISDELGAEVLRCLEPTLEQGRQFEVYGPPVSVPNDAEDFIRALGLSGRDPDWRTQTGRGAQRSRGGSSKAPHTARQITCWVRRRRAPDHGAVARSARLNSVAHTR